MRQKVTKGWLSIWLYVILFASGIITGVLVTHWQVWDAGTKLFAMAAALLPIHVMEEWHFPGGFHTMYNLMKDSEHTDRYSMNQLCDMWTNFIGVIFSCVVLVIGVSPVFLIMQVFLCCAEIFGHFSGGIFLYKKFKDKGKKTIYSPGLFTTLFGYIPIAIGILICLFTVDRPALWQIPMALICSVLLGGFSLNCVEKLCRDTESPYRFTWGTGYLSRFGCHE